MDGWEAKARGREARRRLQAHQRRAGELRARAVAISVVAFALLWGIVFVQMATGHDPVLGSSSTATAARGGKRSGPADRVTDRGEAAGAGAAAAESVETTEPEELEPEYEYVEPEPVEVETYEPEYEPAPVITGQS